MSYTKQYNLIQLAAGKDWPHVSKLIPERIFNPGMLPLARLTGPCVFYGPPKKNKRQNKFNEVKYHFLKYLLSTHYEPGKELNTQI